MPDLVRERAFEILDRLAAEFDQPGGLTALQALVALADHSADFRSALEPHQAALHAVVSRAQAVGRADPMAACCETAAR